VGGGPPGASRQTARSSPRHVAGHILQRHHLSPNAGRSRFLPSNRVAPHPLGMGNTDPPAVVECGQCGARLDEPSDLAIEDRAPCPACGSLGRHFKKTITATVELRPGLGFKGRRPGMRRPFIGGSKRPEVNRDRNKWVEVERTFDRANDRYVERIIDPETGEIIRLIDEPLSEHRGHGDARKRQPPHG
jgi:hypothetical protein